MIFKDNKKGYKKFHYQVLLISKIEIDKKYRRRYKIGKHICLFCLGMAQELNKK